MTLQLHLVLLILMAAFLHAAWNAMMKASGERFLALTSVLATGGLLSVPALFYFEPPDPAAYPYLAASFVFHQGYFVLLVRAYRFGDLSQVYPLARGLPPLLVTGLAMVLAGEWPNGFGMTGILLVSGGIASLSLAGRAKGANDSKAVLYAVATAIFIALYMTADGLGVRRAGSTMGYIAWLLFLTSIPLCIGAVVFRLRDLTVFLKTDWRVGIGGGLFAYTAYGLAMYAFSQGPMGHVAALRETAVLFGAQIGAYRLHETLGPKRIAAAAAISAGLILLQIGG